MRKFDKPWDFFHNYEHNPRGRNHCRGPLSNPYIITHEDGKDKISLEYARGHGRAKKMQWFKFTKRLGDGYDLSSGVKIGSPEGALWNRYIF